MCVWGGGAGGGGGEEGGRGCPAASSDVGNPGLSVLSKQCPVTGEDRMTAITLTLTQY